MFFSNNTKNGHTHDPCSFPDQSFFNLPISIFPFPSPFELDDDLFHQPHNFIPSSSSSIPITEKTTTTTMTIDQKIPRKRSSKKDRHSKISTARGLRDRRMRLSLPVARQFFGLQDLLGVDKGSKTVEWLLIQARPEILKLAKERNYCLDRAKSVCSSNSEGDIVSEYEVGIGNENQKQQVKKPKSGQKEKKRIREPRKTMAKELREMARARARARTREKLQIQIMGSVDNEGNYINNHEWSKITSSWSSPFENGEVEKPITSQFEAAEEAIIDYQNSLGNLLQEHHHQQFADCQFFG